MTSAFDRTVRWLMSRRDVTLLSLFMFCAPLALALEPPTAAEMQVLAKNPDELQRRTEQAWRYGNHKAKPWIVERTDLKLRAMANGDDLHSLPPPAWQGMPTKGTNNILVFLIDFPGNTHVNSYDLITNKLFGAGIPLDFPVESLTKFYERSSYGMLSIKGSALGWYRMQHTRDWYTTTYGTGNEANYAIIKEVADYFDPTIDYRQFDNNGDGKIDYFAVLWAGPDNGWANFWWGYQWELQQNLTHDGVQFSTFSWQWESNPTYPPYRSDYTPGVIIHETGHALGLPDYYDYDGSVGPNGGVGGMDMMDSGVGDHNCFSKFMLEWLTPTVITNAVDNLPLRNSADYPEAVALAKGYTGSTAFAEYFMVQNRAKVNNDQKIPGTGLAIWHVDARLNAGHTDFLYNNSYTDHKLLRLMQADGLEQIEAGRSADAGDFYGPGKVFTPESMPNSQSYVGISTEVRVTDISAPGAVITADFSARDNSPVLDPSPIYVREGTETNVAISLWQAPTTNVTLTVGWLSGSSNLYVAGVSNFTFTPLDYTVPQTLAIGALSDADSNNDVAIFRIVSSGAGVQNEDFAVQQMDTGDTMPPGCMITASANAERTLVTFDFLFDEAVSGFDGADIVATDNIAGGASFLGLTSDPVSNRLYRAVFACADTRGAIMLTVPAGSLTDQSGNLNPNPEYRSAYTLPWVKNDFSDNFDGPVTLWTRSTNVFAEITTDGWIWGPPVFDPFAWSGPDLAYSGANCWGTMAGPYDRSLDAWVQSPTIQVGANPVLSFRLWMNGGQGDVEVNGGTGWRNVTSNSYFTSTGGTWEEERVALDDALFGSRTIQIRFRALDSAMYVDDVSVDSQRDPAVWLVSGSPTNGSVGTTVQVAFQVYNSTTSTLTGVAGEVTCADAGVTIGGGTVAYGTLLPGGVANGATDVSVTLAAADAFGTAILQLQHQSTVGGIASAGDVLPFAVDGAAIVPATNLLTVSVSGSVVNWLGQRLQGNGSATSCIFQVLYAGPDGVSEPPTAAGQATGDDRILYASDTHAPWGRFGEGAGISPNLGTFLKSFVYNLPSNAVVYVRAWDAASYKSAVAYGDSATYTLQNLASQSHAFDAWRVDKPTDFARDSNGDSIPDGWCILHGLDPRQPVQALPLQVAAARAITGFSTPSRVVVSSNFVFIADTGNNRVQVWDRMLTNRLSIFGSTTPTEFSNPSGIAVSRDGTRVAVADTLKYRVRVFSVTPAGVLVPLFAFGSNGSGEGQFNAPMAVAFDVAGNIYVADSKASGLGNNRVQVFGADGAFQQTFGAAGTGDGEFGRLLGLSLGADGTLYAADSPSATSDLAHNRIQAFAGATLFNWPWDVQPGVGGLLYVTDMNNRRIQVLNIRSAPAISVVGMITNAGVQGVFNLPRSAVPAPDDNVLYVADTYNSRVLRLKVTLDVDGDGMDDVWEVLHGLNPADPTDAGLDPDHDGVSNIGEYRIGTDPHNPDSNGNGLYDGAELAAGSDPNASGGPMTLRIESMRLLPPVLSWLVNSGDVCRVQRSPSLLQTNWVDTMTVTSMWRGVITVTNAFSITNRTEFLRVKRIAP